MTTAAKIGAFFLAALIVLCYLIFKIEDIPFGKRARTKKIDIRFTDVAGLDDKSAVRIAGVRKGKVDGIELQPDGTAVAHLALDPDVVLHRGAFGRIRALGLLGDKFVEVVPGNLEAPRLLDGERLAGDIPVGIDDLTKLASDIGKDVKELTAALAGSLGGKQGEAKLDRIVDNVGRLAESLAELVDANRKNVDITMANLTAFSAEIRETLARVDRILDENRGTLKGTIGNAEELSDKLKTTADNLNEITDKLNTGQGTIGKLINDDETHRNLNDALQSVKTGVDSLNTTLSRVNRLQLDLGFHAEYLARSTNSRQYFTLDAIPRENKFYRVEIVAQPRGLRKNQTETTTTTLPDGTASTITRETETFEDQFGLSLQLGYRLKNTVVRAGLIESRGGLGVDQLLFADRVQLTGEAWDFGKWHAGNGKLKMFGRWNFTPNLYVHSGVDEILNPGSRSIFLGAGIRWKDEDLKTLLGAATSFIK